MSDAAGALRLRAASQDDMRRVWEWRNHEATRMASFNTDPIPFERHAEWFPRQLARTDSRMFIVENPAGEAIGVVRFDDLGEAPEVSVALAPDQRGRGYGPLALNAACARIFDETGARRIIALVRRDNPASASAFLRAGFTHAADLDVGGIPSSRYVRVRAA